MYLARWKDFAIGCDKEENLYQKKMDLFQTLWKWQIKSFRIGCHILSWSNIIHFKTYSVRKRQIPTKDLLALELISKYVTEEFVKMNYRL